MNLLFLKMKSLYNIDFMAGVTYTMDLTRAEGDRIHGLSYQGNPIDLKRVFTVAVTTYRARGEADLPRPLSSKESLFLYRANPSVTCF